MANPFLTLGGIAVGIVVATFGVLQVPGWVKSAQDASAISDLSSAAIGEATSASRDGHYRTGYELAADAERLGLSFNLSSGVKLCVTRSEDRTAYAAVAKSPSGAFFARTAGATKAIEGATPEEALDAIGGLPDGVPSPVVDGGCAPGAEIINHGDAGSNPDVELGSDPDYQPFDAMWTFRCDVDTDVTVPMRSLAGTAEWSDGEKVTTEGEQISKNLKAGVTYQVTFEGTFGELGSGEGLECVRSMDSWSDESGTWMAAEGFSGMRNLTSVPANLPPTVISLQRMFKGATSFNDADVAKWDVSNITMTNNMFDGATAFQQDINDWTFSADGWGVQVSEMFANTNYTGDLRNWTFNNPGDAQAIGLFKDASYTGNMSGWTFENEGTVFVQPREYSATGGVIDANMDGWTFQNARGVWVDDMVTGTTRADLQVNDWVFANGGEIFIDNIFANSGTLNVHANRWKLDNARIVQGMGIFGGTGVTTVEMNDWTVRNKDMVNLNVMPTSGEPGNVRGSMNRWLFENTGDLYAANFDGSPERSTFAADVTDWTFRNTGDVDWSYSFDSSAYAGKITGWDFGNSGSVYLDEMFKDNAAFNGDITDWTFRTIDYLRANRMLWGATSFNRDLSAWDLSMVASADASYFAPHLPQGYLPAFPSN